MGRISRRYFIWGALAALALGGGYGWNLWRSFGSLPAAPPSSPNWHNGAFRNLPDNYVNAALGQEPLQGGGWLKFFLERKGNRYPPGPVPTRRGDLRSVSDGEFVWLGHSSCLLRLNGKFICIDPVLSSRASPAPFTIPAWPGANPYKASDFPPIDYLCISHDHWDHLDYDTVSSLQYKTILCGKGVGAHFTRWGLCKPEELDWGDSWQDGGLKFIFTPSRHFSGRGLTRDQSLWGGFVISAGSGGSVYFTGDGGYGGHFTAIGKKYGPFDIVFTDSGQYNRAWPTVHMFPEEAVRAVRDTGSRMGCPVHRGKFTLAWHPWDEPARRFSKRASETGLPYVLPIIGEKRALDETIR